MYKKPDYAQTDIYDFFLPFGGHLDENNQWVVLNMEHYMRTCIVLCCAILEILKFAFLKNERKRMVLLVAAL